MAKKYKYKCQSNFAAAGKTYYEGMLFKGDEGSDIAKSLLASGKIAERSVEPVTEGTENPDA